jgi:hypothetical protein
MYREIALSYAESAVRQLSALADTVRTLRAIAMFFEIRIGPRSLSSCGYAKFESTHFTRRLERPTANSGLPVPLLNLILRAIRFQLQWIVVGFEEPHATTPEVIEQFPVLSWP